MVARQSFGDTSALCGTMKTYPAWAAEQWIQAEVDLLEDSQGVIGCTCLRMSSMLSLTRNTAGMGQWWARMKR